MELIVDITGDITDRQELLNGTETVTLEGISDNARWTVLASVSWNVGLVSYPGEGDLTLTRSDGAEIFGTITRADVNSYDPSGGEDSDHLMRLEYEIDGGTAEFDGAAGTAEGEATLSGLSFRGRWTVGLRSAP